MIWTEIDGWLKLDEGRELQRLAAGQCVLEIGTLFGRSTACMAMTARRVTSVDPHDGATLDGTPWHGVQSLATCEANLAACGVADNVQLIVGQIQHVTHLLTSYSFIFIDGDHSFEACSRDLKIAARLLDQDGGVIVVHDYYSGSGKHHGVIKAVDQFRRGRPFRRVGSLGILDCRRNAA